jgi:parallel beta-helix repeat protein
MFLKNILESNERGIYDNIYPFVAGSNNIKITKNLIKQNSEGINLVWSKPAFIRYNSVEDNSYIGIWISYSSNSFIEYNNFYRNRKNVYLIELNDTINTIIDSNYWGRARVFPKPILGLKKYGEGLFSAIPWIFLDRNPAKEPYDIQLSEVIKV